MKFVKLNRMKMLISVLLSVLLIAGCSTTPTSTTPSPSTESAKPSKDYTINLNVSAGPVHPFTKQVAEPWAQMVEKETNGVVKVKVFPSATLGGLPTALQDIKNGIYEAGVVSPGRHADTELFPWTYGDIPFLVGSSSIAQSTLTDLANKYMKDAFKGGATFMSISSTDAYQLFTKKPIRTAADIKNQKIAITGSGEQANVIKALGGVPVSIDNTSLYESLQKGIVDGALYTAVGAMGYKFEDVTSYMTKLDYGTTNLGFLMNTAFLDSLPADIHKMFTEKFGPEYANLITKLYTSQSESAIAAYANVVKAKGGEVIKPSNEEIQAFKVPVKALMDDMVQKANKKGYNGQEMMDYFTGLLKEKGVVIPK